MFRSRRAPAWLATLAVLLHLFAMPLMGTAAPMMGMAGHCAMAEVLQHGDHHLAAKTDIAPQSHAAHADPSTPPPDPAHHLSMPCCCAAGAAALAAIAPSAPQLLVPRRTGLGLLPLAGPAHASPRYYWPSLNPRASPLA
ncbi:hypothetical protein CH92_05850 [Stutzerimonas stutzeri]|uniref:DUF2946 domain-containing protein n=1 Tax=Stutzerimonas stutzeri TaxID=316 RepID=W8QWH8_STUST|nr:DUF2946 family protein [Stutzerimonas stutzeri]AHL74644.1 hypothetical protein CH92_05850 [Stutzerimonas stutzeri]MCQ4329174.1 DUF2946 domain-containing protein [Stutzerimonas stutzeri]